MTYLEQELVDSLKRAAVNADKHTFLIIDSGRQQFLMHSADLGVKRGWLRKEFYENEREQYSCWKFYFTNKGFKELKDGDEEELGKKKKGKGK